MRHAKYLFPLLALCLVLTACGPKEETVTLDLDYIANTLMDSGYFPQPLEAQDPGLVPGLLSLYEDRISAGPEDIAAARFTMSLGLVADQFILIEAKDHSATEKLAEALNTYAEDQKSAYEFYAPDQAARMDSPIIVHEGNYLLFAVGQDRDGLKKLCGALMSGENVDLADYPPDVSQPDVSEPDTSTPDSSEPDPLLPLTEADKASAQDAARDYYLGTVFEVHTLTEIDTRTGEITFQVSCSKGGAPVDPDRTISLERQNGAWMVVAEGY